MYPIPHTAFGCADIYILEIISKHDIAANAPRWPPELHSWTLSVLGRRNMTNDWFI